MLQLQSGCGCFVVQGLPDDFFFSLAVRDRLITAGFSFFCLYNDALSLS